MIFRHTPRHRPVGYREPGRHPLPQECRNPDYPAPWQKMAFGGTVDPAYDPCGAGPIPATAGPGRRP